MSETSQALAILTGATGVIGEAIQRKLKADGYTVACISRSAFNSTTLNSETNNGTKSASNHFTLDLNETLNTQAQYSALEQLCKAHEEVLLVHCAPIWFLPPHVKELNTLGVKRVIAFSSTSIDGKASSDSAKEKQTISQLKTGEELSLSKCKEENINLTIFRPTMIYGEGQGENLGLIAKVINRFGVFPIIKQADGLRRPVHIGDLANAVSLAAKNPISYNKTYALSGREAMSYQNMVQRVFESLDKPVRFIVLPKWFYRLALRSLKTLAKLAGKSLDIDPNMVDRMQVNLDFSHSDASNDFAYQPDKFLPNSKDDLIK